MTSERRKRAEAWILAGEIPSGSVLAWHSPMPAEWDQGPPDDPGYYLTLTQLAHAVDLPFEDVSLLVRGFRLHEDPKYAEQILYEGETVVLFGQSAPARLRELIQEPPSTLEEDRKSTRLNSSHVKISY